MKLPEIQNCPVCGQGVNLVSRDSGGVNCDSCGFSAVSREVTDANYLANLRPLLGVRVAAQRISNRLPLGYWEPRLAD